MSSNWKNTLLGYATRQRLRVMALAVFWVALGIIVWSLVAPVVWNGASMPTPNTDVIPESSTTTPEEVLHASGAEPRALRIPTLNITASFEAPLGLSEDGSIGVPDAYETVGWYKYGPTPGEVGPAIILGHVDSKNGPAVFFSLGQLVAGDTVEVDRDDGSTVVFAVIGYERVEQSAFPSQRVYGDIPYAGLRLITCSGIYDRGAQRYSHNLIVYGELVDVRYPEKSAE